MANKSYLNFFCPKASLQEDTENLCAKHLGLLLAGHVVLLWHSGKLVD